MSGEEEIDLVDARDEVTGSTTIGDAIENGRLHRAVAVLVVRNGGGLLLQQRSKRDQWHPGLWTLSSTGHVRKGESYDDAAARELREELGIEAKPAPLMKYLLPPIRWRGLTEHEWVALYEARTDIPAIIDPVEVEGVREVDERELRQMMDSGDLTPDSVMLLREYLSLGN